jgi:hypothetical protein
LITYSQDEWGANPGTASALLLNQFFNVYPLGLVTVGKPTGGFSMGFDSADAIILYLPSAGAAAPLNANLLDPSSSISGAFGGEVLALELNVDLSDAGLLGSSGIRFGDLLLTGGLSEQICSLRGLTVRQVLADANIELGGGTSICSIDNLFGDIDSLNTSFDGGTPSSFAQNNLLAPATSVPEPSSLLLLIVGLGSLRILRRV